MPYTALMPIFAGSILLSGAHTFGFLMGASGVGALIGAVTLAARRSVLELGRLTAMTAAGFGASLVAFAASRQLWLSLLLLVVVGYSFMQQMASTNTILQTISEDEKRGRVMSGKRRLSKRADLMLSNRFRMAPLRMAPLFCIDLLPDWAGQWLPSDKRSRIATS
jgi:hypothetical protein